MLRQPRFTSLPGWCQPTSPLGFSPTSSSMSAARPSSRRAWSPLRVSAARLPSQGPASLRGLGTPAELCLRPGLLTAMDQETNPNGGQLVLAGDPQQLGPVLRSPLAIEHGLGERGEGWERRWRGASGLAGSHGVSLGAGTSLLERLMLHNALYQKSSGGYDPQFVTKLLWNYRWGQRWGRSAAGGSLRGRCVCPGLPLPRACPRHGARNGAGAAWHLPGALSFSARSHEAILRIPNELFYDSELKACESDEFDVRSLYCAWEELPKKVRGQEGGGPGRADQSPTLSTPRASPSSSTGCAGRTGERPRAPRSSTRPRSRCCSTTSGSCCRAAAGAAAPASRPRRSASSLPTGSR